MRRLASLLIIVFFAARGLVPAGFMPAAAADGTIGLVICTGHGAQAIAVGEDGKPSKPTQKPSGNAGVCPFAASAPLALAEPLAILPHPQLRVLDMKFPRFRGHPNICVSGVHNVEETPPIPA